MGVARFKRRHSPRPRRIASSDRGANGAVRPANCKPLKFTIDSDFAQGHEVRDRILQDVVRCGYDSKSTWAIKLALEEAMINAMKHGNRMDPRKKVHIEAKVGPRQTEIVIEDEGPGFDRRRVPDPTADENLCKCSGGGILLIEAYMTSVKWTKQGRRLRMIRVNGRKAKEGKP